MRTLLLPLFLLSILQAQHIAICDSIASYMQAGRFEEVHQRLTPATQSQLSVQRLQLSTAMISRTYGNISEVRETILYKKNDTTRTYSTRLIFEKGQMDLRLTFKRNDTLASGIFLTKADRKNEWKLPTYADTTKFTELELTIQSGKYILPAILTIHKGIDNPPVALLLSGSGPQDMDVNIGPNMPFRDIAWGLASKGIASLRFSKRTLVYPNAPIWQKAFTFWDEQGEDALTALDTLRKRDYANIWLVGHSQGGMTAAALLDTTEVAGIILLASSGRSLPQIILTQTENMSSKQQTEQVAAEVERIERGEVKRVERVLGLPGAYWYSMAAYPPVDMIQRAALPTLILFGGEDVQVTKEDYQSLNKELKKEATIKQYPGINHLLMEAPKGYEGLEQYEIPGNVLPEVILDVAEFILEHN